MKEVGRSERRRVAESDDKQSFATLREAVWWANTQLPASGLVTAHSGNASGVHRGSGVVLIKPSGVDYATMRPDDLVPVNLAGERLDADLVPDGMSTDLRPSVDTEHHLHLYNSDATLGGIVHTHSNYATAWAAHGRSLPCILTAIADEFGGHVPCVPYVSNEGRAIADGIMQYRTRAPAVLLANHGVFTFGASVRAALKAAIMVEDGAKTVHLATQIGSVGELPAEEIEKWWARYHGSYGQGVNS